MRLSIDDKTLEAVVRKNNIVYVEAREHGYWIGLRKTIPDNMVWILPISYRYILQIFKMSHIQNVRGLADCEFEIFQRCELAYNCTNFGRILVQLQFEASESVQILERINV